MMKRRVVSLLKDVFGACLMYAVLVGVLVAAVYIIGFIIGGAMGEKLALFGAGVMKSAITVSAIGAAVGMIAFYIEGEHELALDSED
jgi:hypothetical protein